MFPKLRHGWNFLRLLHFLSSEADARSPGRDVRCAQLPSIRVVASIDASFRIQFNIFSLEGKSSVFFYAETKIFHFYTSSLWLCLCVLVHTKRVRCNRYCCLHELLKFRRNGRRRRWNHFMRVKNTARIEHVLHSLHEPNFFCVFPSPKFLNFHRP